MSYDYLPSLTPAAMSTAIPLQFSPYVPVGPSGSLTGWDNQAYYGTSEQYAILRSTFSVNLTAGATYDIFSSSFFDPFILLLYDTAGTVVAIDQGGGSYGMDVIFNYVAPVGGTYYISASWDQGYAAGHRYVSVSVYEDIHTIPEPPVSPPYYGTEGIDTIQVFQAWQPSWFSFDDQGVYVSTNGVTRSYVDVERFVFRDVAVAVDIEGNAGKAYRLYEATFDRQPDKSGLGYWIKQLDDGASLESIAANFLLSAEFRETYGSSVSTRDYVYNLYENILGRGPDQGGWDYWVSQVDTGTLNRAEVLMNFSESPENQLAVIGDIQGGILYDSWG